MVIYFENGTDFNVMSALLEAYEEKRDREERTDGNIFNNVLRAIKKEMKIQDFTRKGYYSKHIRCHICKNVWLALYNEATLWAECPKCGAKISIEQKKKNKEY